MNEFCMLAQQATSAAPGVEIPTGWAFIIISTLLGGIGAGLKIVWVYWTNREKEKSERWKEIVDDKDELIARKDVSLERLRVEKDKAIEELSKKLSLKSDEHALKVEELMSLALGKVESWGDKFMGSQDKFAAILQDLTQELRRIGGDGNDTGFSRQ